MERNKLSEFLKNRLNESTSEDDWANPSKDIDEQVLKNIASYTYNNQPINKTSISKVLALSIIAAMSAIILHLNNQLIDTSNKLEELKKLNVAEKIKHNQIIDDKLRSHKTTTGQTKEQTNILINKNEKLESTKASITQEKKLSNITEQKTIVPNILESSTIIQKNDLINQSTNPLIRSTIQNNQPNSHLMPLTLLNSLLHKPLIIKDAVNNLQPSKSISINTNYKFHPLLRINYGIQLNKLEVPMSWNFENQSASFNNINTNKIRYFSHNINLDYLLKPNWGITLGLKFGKVTIESESTIPLSYNADLETMDINSGQFANQLSLETLSPFSTANYTVDLQYERAELFEGRLIEYKTTDKIKLDLIQIPIGFKYQFRQKKFRFYGNSGFLLNTFRITDYKLSISVTTNENQTIENIRYSPRYVTAHNNVFVSFFGEFGVDIPVNHNWQINLALNGSYNFLSNNKNLNSSPSMNGASWKLGLGYQF